MARIVKSSDVLDMETMLSGIISEGELRFLKKKGRKWAQKLKEEVEMSEKELQRDTEQVETDWFEEEMNHG